jgi:hypothetical protein
MSHARLITNEDEARRVRESAACCLAFDKGFPGQVFHESVRAVVGPCFFDDVLLGDFGEALWKLMRRNRDDRFWIDCADSYDGAADSTFQRLIEINAPERGGEWADALAIDDAYIMAERIAVWGDSHRWAFWAERRYNLGILAEAALSDADRLREPPFERDFDDALFGVIALEFAEYVVPTGFRVELLRNHSDDRRAWQTPLPDEIARPWKQDMLERLDQFMRSDGDEAIDSVRDLGQFCHLKGVPKKLGEPFVRFWHNADFYPSGQEWSLYAKDYRTKLHDELHDWYERNRAELESAAASAVEILRKL